MQWSLKLELQGYGKLGRFAASYGDEIKTAAQTPA
jgi:hypothetical protein